MGSDRDDAAREKAEDTLQRSEQRYREIVENADDIVYTQDLAGRFTSANRPASGYLVTQAATSAGDDPIRPVVLDTPAALTLV